MREVRIIGNLETNKNQITEGKYLYELLNEQPNFEEMTIETTVWINNILLLSSLKIKYTKIKYVRVDPNTFLIIIQVSPRAVDEGYIEIGIVLRSDGTLSGVMAYAIDIPNYPEIQTISLTLNIIPEWWHELDLIGITYLDEKKIKYEHTEKYKYVYVD